MSFFFFFFFLCCGIFFSGKVIICEGNQGSLSCSESPGSTINVKSAIFGRTSSTVCLHDQMEDTNCIASSYLTVVKNQCESKVSCALTSGKSIFDGDPCPGTNKYLEVEFDCKKSGMFE